MNAPTIFCHECRAANALQATYCFACNKPLHAPAPSSPAQIQAVSSHAVGAVNKINTPLAPSYLLHSRYSIVSQVGTGGFGAVYQAKDTLFSNRAVAIKEMSQDSLSSQEMTEAAAAFEHEALMLADLVHPNLPRIHDHFSEQGRVYVVMDFIAGETLEDSLDKFVRRFTVEAALDISIQLATVLDYLHSHQPPIIFRDLKPANMMLTPDNHVYLIDFGIARHFKPGKAKDTIPLGSRGYAAPEQYGKAQSTPQTDIYGLGATLHQLLTGDDPSLKLFHFEPVKLRNSPITAQLNALLKQMVEMEMDKRPATMTDVRQRLQQFLAQLTAQHLSASQRSAIAKVRRRNFLIWFGAAVVTCTGGAISTHLFARQNVPFSATMHPLAANTASLSSIPPATSLARARILSGPLFTYLGHNSPVIAVAWSPSGDLIASAGTLDDTVQIWDANTANLIVVPVLEIDPTERKVLSIKREPALLGINGQGMMSTLAWDSYGTRLASALDTDSVKMWNLKTGANTLFRFSQRGNTGAVAWSPDGSKLAAISGNSPLVCSAITGDIFSTYSGNTSEVLTLAWSPDGTWIASGCVDGSVWVWDATTRRTQATYYGHMSEVNTVAWSPDSRQIASGSSDGTVQLWDAATGKRLLTWKGHAGSVNTVAWQPGTSLLPGNEARIASGGVDATVQVWAVSGKAMTLHGDILLYRGHSAQVTSVSWSPDGQRIASSSEDGTVQLWQAM
jgi:eukaryotic-like serine/threonine-protein kinase